MTRWRTLAVELFLMVAIGTLLALLAPFGSEQLPAALRFGYWVGFIVAGYLIFTPVGKVGAWLAEETRVPRWAAVGLTSVVAALPLTALIATSLYLFYGDPAWFGVRFPLLYLQVAGIGVAIHLLMTAIFRTDAAVAEPASERTGPLPAQQPEDRAFPPFLRRLPPEHRSGLYCLEMQDHYVAAHTAAGATLLLMRFRDAIDELGEAGLQVHRSWWVARDAIQGVEQDGRNLRLRTVNGLLIPVSRSYAPAARAAARGFDSASPPAKSA